MEPALPRKKKHPELAYRTNEVLRFEYEAGNSSDSLEMMESNPKENLDLRARSEERTSYKSKVGTRSRSADPTLGRGREVMLMVQSYPPAPRNPRVSNGEEASDIPKTTEYRAAFAWPPKSVLAAESTTRKSMSMVAIKDTTDGTHVTQLKVHGPVDAIHHDSSEGSSHEDSSSDASSRRGIKNTEYKSKFRPFSSYLYVDGNWRKPKTKVPEDSALIDPNSWYSEVVERLQKADQYRWRSRGSTLYGEHLQQLYNRQGELWTQVDSRSSLAALSLAHTSRSATKPHPKERPLPSSIYRSASAKKREKSTDVEPLKPVSVEKKKESPEKATSPLKPEASSTRKASPAPARAVATRSSTANSRASSKVAPKAVSQPKAALSGPIQQRQPVSHGTRSSPSTTGPRTRPQARPPQESAPVQPKPRAVVRPAAVNGEDGKIWLKPEGKKELTKGESEEDLDHQKDGLAKIAKLNCFSEDEEIKAEETDTKISSTLEQAKPSVNGEQALVAEEKKTDAVRPSSLPPINGVNGTTVLNGSSLSSPPPLPEPHTGPVPLTTVKSPEEVTGVKSPDPETWTVPLDTGRGLEWTDGQPSGDWSRAKSPPTVSSSTPPVESSGKVASQKIESVLQGSKGESLQKATISSEAGHEMLTGPNIKPESGDVLDKARTRLEKFWVTGK